MYTGKVKSETYSYGLFFGCPGGFQPHWLVVDTGMARQWIQVPIFFFPEVLRIAREKSCEA